MPENDQTPTQSASAEAKPERMFTQDELDAIVKDRLKRERDKYADYETLKAKAGKFDAAEEASKSELQKAVERAEQLSRELEAMKAEGARRDLIASVAKEMGVDAELLSAMSGTTEDEIKGHAELLKAKFAAVPGYKADPHDNGSSMKEPPKKYEIPTVF